MIEEEATEETNESRRRRRLPRGRVTVFPNWCKGCNLCVEFCPADVLEQGQDGRVIVAHPESCTACRWCELHCPDFAIFVQDVSPEDEVSKVALADVSKTASEEETA
ncbi:MAG: 4Fe-4S binding protein [Anaerolineae bacterium]|jgi:2-oxoglutarate ferredoxin oxidoreductase subunit delta